jgi:hypothetical protein
MEKDIIKGIIAISIRLSSGGMTVHRKVISLYHIIGNRMSNRRSRADPESCDPGRQSSSHRELRKICGSRKLSPS